ncbi:hypothetical protein NC652_010741 [Populus alba x Populus x berolinensis]|nr:hypothetical protein NC652_010741 [Populus alba x Populus x berolinensis]
MVILNKRAPVTTYFKKKHLHSGTSVLVGTAICNKTTLSRHSGFSSRNSSNANIFWGIPFIISRRSTPNITYSHMSRNKQPDKQTNISKHILRKAFIHTINR